MTYTMAQVAIEAILYSVAFFGLLIFIANIIDVPSKSKSVGEAVKEAESAKVEAEAVKKQVLDTSKAVFYYNANHDSTVLKAENFVLLGNANNVLDVSDKVEYFSEKVLKEKGYTRIGEV